MVKRPRSGSKSGSGRWSQWDEIGWVHYPEIGWSHSDEIRWVQSLEILHLISRKFARGVTSSTTHCLLTVADLTKVSQRSRGKRRSDRRCRVAE